SAGHFVIERPVSIWRFQRYAYLGWITVKFTQIPVLLLAGAGVWRLYKDRSSIDWRLWVQIAFVALFAIAVLFSAHGMPPDPERYVTSREAHLLIYLVLLVAVLGLVQWPRWTPAMVGLSALLGIGGAFWYVHVATSAPDVQLDYRVAQYLDNSLQDGERVLILARPVTEDLPLYLDKARETSGEERMRQAQLQLQELAAMPPDYRRVVVYSRLGRERLLAPPAPCGEWIAVWNDYPNIACELAVAEPVQVLRSGPMSVSILRR